MKTVKLIVGDYDAVKKYFADEVKAEFFEFHFPYVSLHEPFVELRRFISESMAKTRFQNKYTGPVLIDISEWNFEQPNKLFDAFLYYLKDNPNFKCAFFVNENFDDRLKKALSNVFECEIIALIEEKRKRPRSIRIGFCQDEEDLNNV